MKQWKFIQQWGISWIEKILFSELGGKYGKAIDHNLILADCEEQTGTQYSDSCIYSYLVNVWLSKPLTFVAEVLIKGQNL